MNPGKDSTYACGRRSMLPCCQLHTRGSAIFVKQDAVDASSDEDAASWVLWRLGPELIQRHSTHLSRRLGGLWWRSLQACHGKLMLMQTRGQEAETSNRN